LDLANGLVDGISDRAYLGDDLFVSVAQETMD